MFRIGDKFPSWFPARINGRLICLKHKDGELLGIEIKFKDRFRLCKAGDFIFQHENILKYTYWDDKIKHYRVEDINA